MARPGKWINPLTDNQILTLIDGNKDSCDTKVVDGPIGLMVVARYLGKTFYCGGDFYWLEQNEFFLLYPDFEEEGSRIMADPEFDLDEMELAEILIDELNSA